MLTSALPEVAEARGVSTRRADLYFLVVMALATSMTVPVVGALLMFSLMIGPAAAARSVTARPGIALALSVAIALATVWLSIALSYRTNWPLGFFVGIAGAAFYLLGLAARRVRVLKVNVPTGTSVIRVLRVIRITANWRLRPVASLPQPSAARRILPAAGRPARHFGNAGRAASRGGQDASMPGTTLHGGGPWPAPAAPPVGSV